MDGSTVTALATGLRAPNGLGASHPGAGSAARRVTVGRHAGVVKVPLTFATGIMPPRFSPSDGQLYVTGVGGGWQTSGTRAGALYRVRYTNKPSHLPCGFRTVPGGVRLSFAAPLDPTSA